MCIHNGNEQNFLGIYLPLCNELIWVNINSNNVSVLFLNTEMAQIVEIIPHGRQENVYSI